jgi:hypothetical protein
VKIILGKARVEQFDGFGQGSVAGAGQVGLLSPCGLEPQWTGRRGETLEVPTLRYSRSRPYSRQWRRAEGCEEEALVPNRARSLLLCLWLRRPRANRRSL